LRRVLPSWQVNSPDLFVWVWGPGFFPIRQKFQIGFNTIVVKGWIDAADQLKHGKLAP
jgi:hypothetical protein